MSEPTRPHPDSRVIAWLAAVDEDEAFLSVATLAEIAAGIDRLPKGKRQGRMRA